MWQQAQRETGRPQTEAGHAVQNTLGSRGATPGHGTRQGAIPGARASKTTFAPRRRTELDHVRAQARHLGGRSAATCQRGAPRTATCSPPYRTSRGDLQDSEALWVRRFQDRTRGTGVRAWDGRASRPSLETRWTPHAPRLLGLHAVGDPALRTPPLSSSGAAHQPRGVVVPPPKGGRDGTTTLGRSRNHSGTAGQPQPTHRHRRRITCTEPGTTSSEDHGSPEGAVPLLPGQVPYPASPTIPATTPTEPTRSCTCAEPITERRAPASVNVVFCPGPGTRTAVIRPARCSSVSAV